MRWVRINGFEDYEVSDTGLVKSTQRRVLTTAGWKKEFPYEKTINEAVLRQTISGSGYYSVTLRKDGKHFSKRVHTIVAEHYIGIRPEGLVICHKDNNKLNNNYLNLEYGTMAKNTQDYYKSIGKRSGFVLYSKIPEIIIRISEGESIYKIAEEYNVQRNDIAVLNKIIAFD